MKNKFQKNTFEYIENKIRNSQKNSVDLGSKFAWLCKYFFDNSKYWQTIFRRTWYWEDWPYCWGRDKGIDLVAQTHNGDYWAIQAKGYQPEYSPSKKDFDTFLTESNAKNENGKNYFKCRLFIASSWNHTNLNKLLERQILPVQTFLRNKFLDSNFSWPTEIYTNTKKINKKPPKPFKFQKEAIKNVLKSFKKHKKGKLIMACGTGKTYTSLKINEQLRSKITLYVVPSISLIDQTFDEWNNKKTKNFDPLLVCSDKDLLSNSDSKKIGVSELLIPPTTDHKVIREFIKKKSINSKVIFVTYHSLDKIYKATKINKFKFDLVLFDEAHHTAGDENSFSLGLDDTKIISHKKLFMTATPLIINEKKLKLHKDAGFNLISMDNEKLYGPIKPFYRISFDEAIKKKILANYKVICIGSSIDELKDFDLQKYVKANKIGSTDLRTLASQIGLLKSIKDYRLKRIITFHSNINSAKQYTDPDFKEKKSINTINLSVKKNTKEIKLYTNTINSKLSSGHRKRQLNILKNIDSDFPKHTAILSNCFCLGEGVDVPELDCVAFISEKHSPIDITQAVGRAIRRPKKSGKTNLKKIGYIFIPLLINSKNNDQEIDKIDGFKTITRVLRALRSHDDELSRIIDEIRNYSTLKEPNLLRKLKDKIEIKLPKKINTQKFADSLYTRIIELSRDKFESNYKKLKIFFDKYGHSEVPSRWNEDESLSSWVGMLRAEHYKKYLSEDRIVKLEKVNFRFETQKIKNKFTWDQQFSRVKKYYNKFKNFNIPRKTSKNYVIVFEGLASWIKTQRKNYKNKNLSIDKVDKLNSINFTWDPIVDNDLYFLEQLLVFYKKFENFSVPRKGKYKKLAMWLTGLRQRKKNSKGGKKRKYSSKIPQEITNKLNKISEFYWEPRDAEWMDRYNIAKNYWLENNKKWIFEVTGRGKKRPAVANWCARIRTAKKRNSLKKWQIDFLNKINFIWNVRDYEFQTKIDLLISFKKKFKHLNISTKNEYIEFSKVLVNWVTNIKQGNISLSKKEKNKIKIIGLQI